MSVVLRTASIDDAEQLAALGERTFTETFGHLYTAENLALFLENHSLEAWRRDLSDPTCAVCVGQAGEEPIAYAKLLPPDLPVESAAGAVELKQFYVLNGWHGAGVAHQLMDWVIDQSTARGAGELYLSVFTQNERARRFYARYGFAEIGRWKFMVGSHADEDIIMRRSL
jgi:diamine N-acetyltransferase